MPYSKEIKDKANETMKLRKAKAKNALDEKRLILYKNYPRVAYIDKELSKTGVNLVKIILNKKDTKNSIIKLKNYIQNLKNEKNDILKKANLPVDYLDIKYNCSKCKDTGFVDGIMCGCYKDLLRKEEYKKLNNLSPLSLSSFEKFNLEYYSKEILDNKTESQYEHMEFILNYCTNYAENFSINSENLFINGNTGLGKTHLSLSIANCVIEKGFGVIYSSTPVLISALKKESYNYNNDRKSSYTEENLNTCDLLIIDDLGTEYKTPFSTTTIYNIINNRLLVKKPTIINTNLTLRELENFYSERLVSRIMGEYKHLKFLGTDIRYLKAISNN